MKVACLDLEGVLVPEIWIHIAERTGIPELRITTRAVSDYDALMRKRLSIIEKNDLRLQSIQAIIESMVPLEGAQEFLNWMRERFQVIILSDTFYEFALPLLRQLGWPTLFCNRLDVDPHGRIINYHLRQIDPKAEAVKGLRALNFRVIVAGDSYNDTTMLAEADAGILFRPPVDLRSKFPQFSTAENYEELQAVFLRVSKQVCERGTASL